MARHGTARARHGPAQERCASRTRLRPRAVSRAAGITEAATATAAQTATVPPSARQGRTNGDLPVADDTHRRVLAVLAFLRA